MSACRRAGRDAFTTKGPAGDFTMTNFTAEADGQPWKFGAAAQSFASGQFTASAAIDDNLQSGWSIDGGQGKAHSAVFKFATPLAGAQALKLSMQFARHYSADLGRFRISVTDDPRADCHAQHRAAGNRALLLVPEAKRTAADRRALFEHFLTRHSGTRGRAQAEIAKLASIPDAPPTTTLVMSERPPDHPRPTFLHKRGEFLQPGEEVSAGVPSVLPPLPPGVAANRLSLRPLARLPGESAHRARHRQSPVGHPFRPRHRQDDRGLRPPGLAADAPRAARLAGRRNSSGRAGL